LAPTTQDDGFREIQLSGKQLVFLFSRYGRAGVTFLTASSGRGVRAGASGRPLKR
jgi:hypothetical protein